MSSTSHTTGRTAPGASQGMRISGKKTLVFSLVPVLCLLLLLVLLEIGVRLFGPPSSAPLIRVLEYDGLTWKQVNRSCLTRFFPASSAVIPEFKPTIVQSPKPPGTLRILCLGESSMFGTPYHAGATIPTILQKQLRHLFPERTVEVVNLGASAINTNVIRALAPEALDLEPDLVLVYTGHNEFYGPDGVGASWLEKQLPLLTRWKYALRKLRLMEIVQGWLRSAWLTGHAGAEQNLMRQVSAGAQVRLDSEEAARILSLFADNLGAIAQELRDHGIPVIMSDVSSNLMFPPFAADDLPGLEPIPALFDRGRASEAVQQLGRMRPSDSSNAAVEYWLGRGALAAGESASARRHLERARDEDLLKFRAPAGANNVIGGVCRRLGLPLVSADSALSAASPGGITGPTLFWEHLHPRAEGYYRIADLFLRELLQRRLAGADDPEAFAHRLPFQTDSLSISWLDQAIADLSIEALTSRWPFDRYKVPPVVFTGADTALQRAALEVYGRRTTWDQAALRTASWFAAHGMARQAQTTYEAMLEEYPRAWYVRYLLATLLKGTGDAGAAKREYAGVLKLKPDYPFAHADLGLLLINEGRFDEASEHLRSALLSGPGGPPPAVVAATALYGLAAVAANRGLFNEATRLLDESLQRVPTYRPARELRARITAMR